ncbi:MAG: Glutamate 5-kinase [Planctomycetota bacterium]|jgi:glutamate 5-kinase
MAGEEAGGMGEQRDEREYRGRLAADAHTVVVKVGTRVLTDERGYIDRRRVGHLAEQLVELRRTRRVVLVSSGAVAAGMSTLGYTKRPGDLAELQAVAAVGQAKLIEAYNDEFRKHAAPPGPAVSTTADSAGHHPNPSPESQPAAGEVPATGAAPAAPAPAAAASAAASGAAVFHAAQVLLGADDFQNRVGYLNVRNTLVRLLEFPNVIPVINENDTVSVEELQTTFGDNDKLAALVTNLLAAPLLIILSTVDGLLDEHGAVVSAVTRFDDRILGLVCDQKTGYSKGGMASKLKNAQLCARSGETVVIANGRREHVLTGLVKGEPLGTLFFPQSKPVSALKRWIGAPATSRGKILVNSGARTAVERQGGSLLAVGIVAVEGEFQKGDVVSLCFLGEERGTESMREFARGLTNYSAGELSRIKGSQSQRIAEILGHRPYEEVIHRDNMVLVG